MGTDLKTTRAFNFHLLRQLQGGHKALAKKLDGIANWKYVSDFALGTRAISDYAARAIENRLNLTKGWLDRDNAGFLKSTTDEFEIFSLVRRTTPEIRAAMRTLLQHGIGNIA